MMGERARECPSLPLAVPPTLCYRSAHVCLSHQQSSSFSILSSYLLREMPEPTNASGVSRQPGIAAAPRVEQTTRRQGRARLPLLFCFCPRGDRKRKLVSTASLLRVSQATDSSGCFTYHYKMRQPFRPSLSISNSPPRSIASSLLFVCCVLAADQEAPPIDKRKKDIPKLPAFVCVPPSIRLRFVWPAVCQTGVLASTDCDIDILPSL